MLLNSLIMIALSVACTLTAPADNTPNLCPNHLDSNAVQTAFYYGDRNSCKYYYSCDNGKAIRQECPKETVWSDFFQTCVEFNSHYDTCTRENAQRECEARPGQKLLIPHPSVCQRYFDCSKVQTPDPRSYLRKFEGECPYSDVFDVVLKKCISYKVGYCGPLRVPDKDPCKYVKNLCGSAHCEPCSSRLPSCEGLSDGIYAHPLKLWSPYAIKCTDGRLEKILTCRDIDPTGTKPIFSPVKKECVTPSEIPTNP